jgi:hypothetical protein
LIWRDSNMGTTERAFMSWTGEFKQLGFYKFGDNGQVWEMCWRRESPTEPAGWYLYGPAGSGVVARFLHARKPTAQSRAEQFVWSRGAEEQVAVAQNDALEDQWTTLLGNA